MVPDIESKNRFFEVFRDCARMIIEVFTRKNFGHRYHRIRVLLFIEFMLFIIPKLSYRYWPGYEFRRYSYSFWDVYWTWYVFMAAFFLVSCYHISVRSKNRKTLESQLKTSQWWGDPHPIFYKMTISQAPSRKVIAIVLEPLLFLILGRILLWFDQKLGWVFILCAITYAIDSYLKFGDFNTYIEDQKDNQILGKVVSEHLSQPLMTADSGANIPVNGSANTNGTQPDSFKNDGKSGRVR